MVTARNCLVKVVAKKKKKKQKLEVKEETPKQSPVNNNKKEKVATATKQGEDASWECHKCTLINAPGRSRCEGCRSWKGGQRQGFSPSSQQGSSSVTKKKSSNEQENSAGAGNEIDSELNENTSDHENGILNGHSKKLSSKSSSEEEEEETKVGSEGGNTKTIPC